MQKEILAVRHLSLKLNDRLLLKDFCLSVFEGETLALCGIRDAGKSVLARTLVGEFPDYQGKIILNGKTVQPNECVFPNIYYISRDNTMISNMSVMDNYCAIRPVASKLFYNKKEAMKEIEDVLKSISLDLMPDTKAEKLSFAQAHLLQIKKALSLKAQIIILDGITEDYSNTEFDSLIALLHSAHNSTFIYICDRESPITRVADRVVFLRNGRDEGMMFKDTYDSNRFQNILYEERIETLFSRASHRTNQVILEMHDFLDAYPGLNLEVFESEIVGILDQVGDNWNRIVPSNLNGYTIEGFHFQGRPVRDLEDAVRGGLAFVSFHCDKDFFPSMSLRENITFQLLRKFDYQFFISKRIWKFVDAQYLKWTRQKSDTDNWSVVEMMLFKWMLSNPKVMVVENLTAGIPPLAKANIFQMMNAGVNDGMSILFISSVPEDCFRVCDRVLVLKDEGDSILIENTKDKEKTHFQKVD